MRTHIPKVAFPIAPATRHVLDLSCSKLCSGGRAFQRAALRVLKASLMVPATAAAENQIVQSVPASPEVDMPPPLVSPAPVEPLTESEAKAGTRVEMHGTMTLTFNAHEGCCFKGKLNSSGHNILKDLVQEGMSHALMVENSHITIVNAMNGGERFHHGMHWVDVKLNFWMTPLGVNLMQHLITDRSLWIKFRQHISLALNNAGYRWIIYALSVLPLTKIKCTDDSKHGDGMTENSNIDHDTCAGVGRSSDPGPNGKSSTH